MTSASITARDCVEALRSRFEARAYAIFEEVSNGTGSRARRRADAVAMSLWPSRGLMLHGFEVKVSRQDWKRELSNPAKSSEIQSYCDHWWIVSPLGIVAADELPPTWGLLEVTEKKKTLVTAAAPKLECKPFDRHFVAALLRRAAERVDAQVSEAFSRGRDRGAIDGKPAIESKLRMFQEQSERLEKIIADFHQASGINLLYEHDVPRIGKLVERLRYGAPDVSQEFRRDAERYRAHAKMLEESAEEVERVALSRKAKDGLG